VKRHTGRVQSARGIPSTLAEKTEHIGNFAAKRHPISPAPPGTGVSVEGTSAMAAGV